MHDASDAASAADAAPVSPVRARLVGGVQWAVTGFYVFALAFLGVGWYLTATGRAFALSARWELLAVLLGAFLAGYGWVAVRSPAGRAPRAHGRRVEVTLLLLVLGFLVPFGALAVLDLLGTSMLALPFFAVPGASYALTLAISYGVVYGLDARPLLGREPAQLQE
ncbi:hypothetical protein [Halorussus marinus]|uniref:hypothetical protein n=1 Tax=Halorussus marinus TaxID=2505976 RepID=UPI00106E7ACD|nr:hypothetical protein [Halorussus marinus]